MSKSKTFWNCDHKLLYLYLALRHRMSPFRVHKLAHAILKDDFTLKDEMVLDDLYDLGVITLFQGDALYLDGVVEED